MKTTWKDHGKSDYIFIGGHTQIDYIIYNGIDIESSRNETFLGVNLYSKI